MPVRADGFMDVFVTNNYGANQVLYGGSNNVLIEVTHDIVAINPTDFSRAAAVGDFNADGFVSAV